MTHSAK